MRVSTSQIFESGITGITRNQADTVKTQSQITSGRRVLTPADDPVASARALVLTQSREVNTRYLENQTTAQSSLGLIDGYTQSTVNLIQNVRQRVVEAGNTTLSNIDRQAIATELEARMQELIGLANSQDGEGQYVFSGYQGGTRPFSIDPGTGQVAYAGDSGERLLQVESSRFMPTNVAGDDLFMNARDGNGRFVARTGGNQTELTPPPAQTFSANGINQGTGTIDAGSVLDPSKWANAANPGKFMIRFSVTTPPAGVPPTTTYELYDNSNPLAPVSLSGGPQPYVAGQKVALQDSGPPVVDFGASVTLSGAPADGDSFSITPSTSQSLFKTLQNVITALKTPVGGSAYSATQLSNDLAVELTNLDQNLDKVGSVQAKIGSRMQELDALSATAADVDLQYRTTISGLVDLDYAKALSDFSQQQLQLEAARKSFTQITQLGLFNYL